LPEDRLGSGPASDFCGGGSPRSVRRGSGRSAAESRRADTQRPAPRNPPQWEGDVILRARHSRCLSGYSSKVRDFPELACKTGLPIKSRRFNLFDAIHPPRHLDRLKTDSQES